MFRDRTNLFLSYRRTFPHNRSFHTTVQDPFADPPDLENGSTLNNDDDEAYPMMDMSSSKRTPLPPKFFDYTQQIDENLSNVNQQMVQLAKLYRKNSLPGFQDKTHDEKEIEEISYDIIKAFQNCYKTIKLLQVVQSTQIFKGKQLTKGEIIILDNLQKNYATKIQTSSNKFRVLQNNYLRFLNKDDFKPLPTASSDQDTLLLLQEEENDTQQEIDSYSRQTLQKQTQRQNSANTQFLQQREEEITELARGVLEVSTIFREMQNLIIDQGTVVDRIDYNLENTVIELKQAQKELDRATHYQKRTQKCKVILLLSLVIVALFFFVMLKPHHHGASRNDKASAGKDEKAGNEEPKTDGDNNKVSSGEADASQ